MACASARPRLSADIREIALRMAGGAVFLAASPARLTLWPARTSVSRAATSASATLALPDGPPAATVGPCLACSQLQPVIGVEHRGSRTRESDVSRHE